MWLDDQSWFSSQHNSEHYQRSLLSTEAKDSAERHLMWPNPSILRVPKSQIQSFLSTLLQQILSALSPSLVASRIL